MHEIVNPHSYEKTAEIQFSDPLYRVQLMDPTAGRSRPSPGEFSFFSGLVEKSVLDSLFRDLPDDADAAQDSPTLHNWFSELLRRCLKSEEFDQALSAARSFVPKPGNPVFSTPLDATGSHRLSLLGIHPLKPIPLHDHPNVWGAQMILSGCALVRQYDTGPEASGSSTLTYLQAASAREFGVDGISTVTPGARNIHDLAATTDNAVLLSIQHPSCSAAGNGAVQSWFFPVNPLRRDEPLLLCHRVKKKTRVTIRGVERCLRST